MADEILIFDKAGSGIDGGNPGSPLSVGPGTSYGLLEAHYPAPQPKLLWAQSIDTDGSTRADPSTRENRTVTLTFDMVDTNDALLFAFVQKYAKLQSDGGTLHRTMRDGTTVRIYDVLTVDGLDPSFDLAYYLGGLSEVTITLTCEPAARGAEVDLGDNVETTLPVLIFSETVSGDVPALGRLVIDNDDATNDQWWTIWGIESSRLYTFTDSTGSGALFYQAESRTAMGGSAIAVGPSGASGAGSNVMRSAALPKFLHPVLSTQASGGGAHLTHAGNFRVFARVQTPTGNFGTISLAFAYSVGDLVSFTQNDPVDLPETVEGTWQFKDLGSVVLPKAVTGTHRWEGRVLASSTRQDNADTVDVDYLMFIPVDEGSGVAQGVIRRDRATSMVAWDDFNATVGALAGETADLGGTWAGAGDADDFQAGTANVQRTAVSDAFGVGRWATLGSTNYAATAVQTNLSTSTLANDLTMGVLARYTATTDYLVGYIYHNAGTYLLAITTATFVIASRSDVPINASTTYTIRLTVDRGGRAALWFYEAGTTPRSPLLTGYHPSLATGGTLASGKPGLFDYHPNATAVTRTYDDFYVWQPDPDGAILAGQSLAIQHNGVFREDSAGTAWPRVSRYVPGDYLRVPVAGAEARTTRVIVKACRNDPTTLPDPAIDDISAKLFASYRYLS